MTVITVSRQRGSMGSYIALEVAQRLGLRYLDREIIESVAREAGVSVKEVEDIEARAGRLARVLRILGAKPKLPSVASASIREQESYEVRVGDLMEAEGLSRRAAIMRLSTTGGLEYVPRLDYLDLVTSIITEYASKDHAMVVGRGGQMILRGEPQILHVQIRARFETRVYNIIQREGIKWRPAAHRVRISDEQRAGYLRRFYNVDWLDPSLYDLVINTDHIPLEAATEMIILAAQGLAGAEAEE